METAADDSYWQRVAAGVRAELARQRRNALDLVPVLGLSRNAVYSRVNGKTVFKLDEIDKVTQFLGVSLADLAEPRREAVA
jgi:hypothetical protein